MKVLIFDTETTGLPAEKNIPAAVRQHNWPHIVSISWTILDTDTNQVIKRRSYIIRPSGWDIPFESTNIHGITQQKALLEGHMLHDVLLEFITERYDMLVAHNLWFDFNVLRNAMVWDLTWRFNPLKGPSRCTMELSKDMCKLPGKYESYKLPKLSELYIHVFKKEPDFKKLHDSAYDTLILTEIIQHSNELRYKMGISSNNVD